MVICKQLFCDEPQRLSSHPVIFATPCTKTSMSKALIEGAFIIIGHNYMCGRRAQWTYLIKASLKYYELPDMLATC